MENLLLFLHIIAWAIGISSTLFLIIRILGLLTYSDLSKSIDNINGVEAVFPVKWPFFIALICWAFIIAF